jgi:hypothetical protein
MPRTKWIDKIAEAGSITAPEEERRYAIVTNKMESIASAEQEAQRIHDKYLQ